MRMVGGVVNTAIVMAAAEGIIASRDSGKLREHGGLIQITKAWAKSLLVRMGYVKRKCSNPGKISVSHFKELQDTFLTDIQAEVVMNEIHMNLSSTGIKQLSNWCPQGNGPCIKLERKSFPSQALVTSDRSQLFWQLL